MARRWVAPQSVTAIVLVTQGAVAAGRVGMTFAIATAPLDCSVLRGCGRDTHSTALLLSRGGAIELRRLATRATLQAVAVATCGAIAAAAVVSFVGGLSPTVASRALPARWISRRRCDQPCMAAYSVFRKLPSSVARRVAHGNRDHGALIVTAGTFAVAVGRSAERTVGGYAALVIGARAFHSRCSRSNSPTGRRCRSRNSATSIANNAFVGCKSQTPQPSSNPLITVVTPCYNEEPNVREIYLAVKRELTVCQRIGTSTCSSITDRRTARRRSCVSSAAADPAVKVILNTRNFGPIRSPVYGLLQARGDAVIGIGPTFRTRPR